MKSPPGKASAPGYSANKQAVMRRLSRVEGQVRGIRGMISEEAYCIEVLTQIAAATKALNGVAVQLLADHTAHCVRDAVAAGGTEADEKIGELTAAVERFSRTR